MKIAPVESNNDNLIDYSPEMLAKLLQLDEEVPAATFANDDELMAWLDGN